MLDVCFQSRQSFPAGFQLLPQDSALVLDDVKALCFRQLSIQQAAHLPQRESQSFQMDDLPESFHLGLIVVAITGIFIDPIRTDKTKVFVVTKRFDGHSC